MYAFFVAGIDLCATLTITGYFPQIDFTEHPFGGVIRVERRRSKKRDWYEEPHNGPLYYEKGTYWETPPYTIDDLKSKLEGPRLKLVERLSSKDINLSMSKFQSLLSKES